MFVVYLVLLNMVCFFSPGVCLCIVSLCSGCDGCSAFFRCFGVVVSLLYVCACVYPIAVLNTVFCVV